MYSGAKSADRALSVLSFLATRATPTPTMTIARECSIPKSSTHHLLNLMRERNFVTYYEVERAWGLGVAVFEIGSAYLRRTPLRRLGRPILEQLAADINHTTHMAVLHGTDVLYIDKEEPPENNVRLVTEVGVRLPAHLTAVGRAILAELPEEQVRAIYADQPLVSRTEHHCDDLDSLITELAEVRESSYAYDDQMVTPGICCLAAPVFSHEGVPMAAVGTSYVVAQCDDEQVERLAVAVTEAGRLLSSRLGWSGDTADRGREAA
ncbi:MAG: IclR family transcriptional regulator [Solirubrobacterales bacterium]|nr:IclR family transcriptional regulator [Solirubrobacterales bacterium]OJU93786.1 MAG: hypothetical protein BGO23_14315 [Solirubrobacterales bacterium 67-14]